jgi:hypothetical protein
MSQGKRVPKSDADRSIALSAAKTKKDASAPEDNVISAANSAALDIEQPLFDAKKELQVITQSNYHISVEAFNLELDAFKKRITHGFQDVNNQINDNVPGWSPGDRILYGGTLETALPSMKNEREIMFAGVGFIKGETDHIAAGGTPLAMITKAEITTKLASLTTKQADREAKKKLNNDATQVVVARRKVVDPLLVKIWKDIENGGQNLEAPARRVFEISWGVVFKTVKNYGFLNVKCVDSITHAILRGINLRLGAIGGKGGVKATTDEYGVALLKSRNFKPTFINAESMNYEIVSQEVTLAENETQVVVLNMVLIAIV